MPNREVREAPVLPNVATPWPEGDTIENDIVEALRLERPSERAAERQPTAPAPTPEPAQRDRRETANTTLGDLAERLEEALAREVQAANQLKERDAAGPSVESNDNAESSGQEARRRSDARRAEPKERSEPQKPAVVAAEPETRRETTPSADRREEAPVISLNSRRREAVDPLEDEMARLLGELTGDTKSR
jgi:hypothetical protein